MLLPLILALAGPEEPPAVYYGRSGNLDVRPPRIEADITIDGALDEVAWGRAALLTGFSQFSPTDGVPASDSTEVLVWYAPGAIYFGIRAYEAHGEVHATLADRDKIGSDDFVQILLGTFGDGRQATVFAVNPLGVQSDGALVETGTVRGGNGFTSAVVRRETADLSPDYVYESKGRVTSWGYEVEVRIPFKSLRYQAAQEQTWVLNVTRQVQHSGHEDSWAPARRASASFLGQGGHLVGLTDLHRGLVLDLNPSVTSRTTGAPSPTGWDYQGGSPEFGGTVRWGISNNLSLTGTANPDFSQVESDAGQLLFDPRDESFFQEKRPFFLDGIEQFTTPNNLIYTRRVVQPAAAAKLTGKYLSTDVAVLSAVDDQQVSADGQDHPFFNILRLQRDVGAESRIGVVYTDRIEGGDYSRLAGADARLVFRKIYSVQLQLAGSSTRLGGESFGGPLWMARVNGNGRTFGWRSSILASSENFRARSGFFPRPGLVHLNFDPRVAAYGKSGALMESVTFDVNLNGRWRYRDFVSGGEIMDEQLHFNLNSTLRGGWELTGSLLLESFGYPYEIYGDYRVEVPLAGGGADTAAFVGQPRIPNRDYVLSVTTPEFKTVLRQRVHPLGQRRELLRVVARADHHRQRRAQLASDRPDPGREHLCLAGSAPPERRQSGQSPAHPAGEAGVPAFPADLPPGGGRVPARAADAAPRRHPHRGRDPHLRSRRRRLRPDRSLHPVLLPRRPALLVSTGARHRRLPGLRQHDAGSRPWTTPASTGVACAG